MSHREGKVKFINDLEGLLETGRPTFEEWRLGLLEDLHVGNRVAGRFRKYYGDDQNVRPRYASPPETGVIYTIEAKEGSAFVIRYDDRTAGYRSRRASFLFYPTDRQIIGYDKAKVEDMEYYLSSRTNRHEYVDMFPLLKSLIAAKKAEQEEEAPIRKMLAGVLARENKVTVEQAEESLPELIDWYKLTAKYHKPLVFADPPEVNEINTSEFQEQWRSQSGRRGAWLSREAYFEKLVSEREAKIRSFRKREASMIKQIVQEHKSRMGLAAQTVDRDWTAILNKARLDHPDLLLFALKKGGRYVVFTPANDQNVYVHEHEYNHHGRHFPLTAEWRLPGTRPERNFQVYYTSDVWSKWDRDASATDHLTDPEYDKLKAEVLERIPDDLQRYFVRQSESRWRRSEMTQPDRLVSVSYTGRGFDAAVFRAPASIPTEKLLTSDAEEPGFYSWTYEWEKGRNGVEYSARGPWNKRVDRKNLPWEGDKVVYVDLDNLATAQKEQAAWGFYQKQKAELKAQVGLFIDSIKREWIENAWTKAYNRFIDDYADETLWPDHKKAIKIQYPYTHAAKTWRNADEDALYKIVEWAIENAIAIDGKRPTDVLKASGLDLVLPNDISHLIFKKPKTEQVEDDAPLYEED